ncbi:hypothetical protein F5890DRAFT_1547140 [Lentinula detonsa]|uniref:Uncharacterized protein n=1 Tax=Lentinula detonsa TaxID=2804962 RepID=A0AA38PQ13_9AGAR|nr:hypothetical protein F5890DRAFT_1547140 [Lentinula detonsa]
MLEHQHLLFQLVPVSWAHLGEGPNWDSSSTPTLNSGIPRILAHNSMVRTTMGHRVQVTHFIHKCKRRRRLLTMGTPCL